MTTRCRVFGICTTKIAQELVWQFALTLQRKLNKSEDRNTASNLELLMNLKNTLVNGKKQILMIFNGLNRKVGQDEPMGQVVHHAVMNYHGIPLVMQRTNCHADFHYWYLRGTTQHTEFAASQPGPSNHIPPVGPQDRDAQGWRAEVAPKLKGWLGLFAIWMSGISQRIWKSSQITDHRNATVLK